jgi:hypothetical protein
MNGPTSGSDPSGLETPTEIARLRKTLPSWFTALDTEGVGQVTFKQWRDRYGPDYDAHFSKYDRNDDGFITYVEMQAYAQRYKLVEPGQPMGTSAGTAASGKAATRRSRLAEMSTGAWTPSYGVKDGRPIYTEEFLDELKDLNTAVWRLMGMTQHELMEDFPNLESTRKRLLAIQQNIVTISWPHYVGIIHDPIHIPPEVMGNIKELPAQKEWMDELFVKIVKHIEDSENDFLKGMNRGVKDAVKGTVMTVIKPWEVFTGPLMLTHNLLYHPRETVRGFWEAVKKDPGRFTGQLLYGAGTFALARTLRRAGLNHDLVEGTARYQRYLEDVQRNAAPGRPQYRAARAPGGRGFRLVDERGQPVRGAGGAIVTAETEVELWERALRQGIEADPPTWILHLRGNPTLLGPPRMHTLDLPATRTALDQMLENMGMNRGTNNALVYIVRDRRTGELLKVGETSDPFRRFADYIGLAREDGRSIAIDIIPVDRHVPRGMSGRAIMGRQSIERSLRYTLSGDGHTLPWDQSTDGWAPGTDRRRPGSTTWTVQP